MRLGLAFALVVLSIVSLVLSACAPAAPTAPSPTLVPAVKTETKSASKAAEAETKPASKSDSAKAEPNESSKNADAMAKYEALVEAAKKEGKIVVTNSQAFVRDALRDSFGKKFGIDVEFIHEASSTLFTRLRAERQAGQYNIDAAVMGATTLSTNMVPEGMIEQLDNVLILPEVTDPSKWIDGQIPWIDRDHHGLRANKYVFNGISINTSLVKKGEINGYQDLLDPRWKGKIAGHDPTQPGGGSSVAVFLALAKGEDFVKQLYLGQEVVLSKDERQLGDWLARGRYPIIIWTADRQMDDMQKDGLPVEIVVTNDVSAVSAGWGTIAMFTKAPHPNAAKLFVNWMASKEGQEMWVKTSSWPVTRLDVDQSSMPDYQKLKPGVKYVDTDDYDYIMNGTKVRDKIREWIQR